MAIRLADYYAHWLKRIGAHNAMNSVWTPLVATQNRWRSGNTYRYRPTPEKPWCRISVEDWRSGAPLPMPHMRGNSITLYKNRSADKTREQIVVNFHRNPRTILVIDTQSEIYCGFRLTHSGWKQFSPYSDHIYRIKEREIALALLSNDF